MGKTACLDALPLPKEKKDLRTLLLLHPSASTPFPPPPFCRTAACTAIITCRSPEEFIENDLLIGCTKNSSSFSLMSIHSSPILVTFLNFLPNSGISPDPNGGGRRQFRFRPISITTKSPLSAAMAGLELGGKSEGGWI